MGNRYLIDSHVLLWAVDDQSNLSEAAISALADPSNLVFVSIASLWELSIKINTGKLQAPEDFFPGVLRSGYELLSISLDHLQEYRSLPLHHRDPFDRILVAQARCEQLTVVTHDKSFDAYEVGLLKI